MRVTLTLMPLAMVVVIAGRPASVAGILMNRFGRSTSHHRCAASASVASVSCARPGATPMETRPPPRGPWGHPAGDAAAPRLPPVPRPQQVAGVADVGGRDGAQRFLDAHLPDGQRVHL